MAIEIEQKFEVSIGLISSISESLRNDPTLGNFTLSYARKVTNFDTYFDVSGQIASREWSLRVREKSAGAFSVALKRPRSGVGGSAAIHREELENPADGSLAEVLTTIVDILKDENIISAPSVAIETLIHRGGIAAALRELGLINAYPVKTTRDIWVVADANGDIAELVVDETEYLDASEGSVREGRIEVEISDAVNANKLTEVSRCLGRRFNIREVHTSKFQQALVHHASRHLRDKLEAKVTLGDVSDYETLLAQIDASSEFVRGYQFHRSADRRIFDTYFDTKKHELFRRGWYLRLRREGESKQLTFRRLKERGEQRYGLVMQQEIVVQPSSDMNEAWSAIQNWLAPVRGASRSTPPADFSRLEASLAASGLHNSLEVDVTRTSWIVDRADVRSSDLRNRIAKVKYDRVAFRRPSQTTALSHFEFEVTGVEDEDAAPNTLRRDSYQAFLGDFLEVCVDKTNGGQVDKRTSAKYFHGLTELGIVKKKPEWLTDGRLELQILARESAPEAVQSRNWGLMRFWSALATLTAGLFALSAGQGDGLLTGGSTSIISITMQTLGFFALVLGSFFLFKDPPGPVSRARRLVIIVCTVMAAVVITIPFMGRGNAADATAFLGLLPLVISLSRNGMRG
ncbi:CYTH domain-containing protein [Streptomyces montanus]|uniref:CYTH domain-containing protein n=1 Tax=Streptomyces montanus TaxID=2580423 RepID=A0A5R9FHR2_9ACTN|nr:CYTH domain-containing protein [Streptomyces montanus]TLS41650.1 CYTH domain-containing protein [Streptomyces montanus]